MFIAVYISIFDLFLLVLKRTAAFWLPEYPAFPAKSAIVSSVQLSNFLFCFRALLFIPQIAQLREDVLPQLNKGYLGMQDLDLTPVSMDRVAFEFLHRFRPGGHFQLVKGYH